jgi:uncharacterized protein YecE (DUF72 family)
VKKSKVNIGTSGFYYKHWLGNFYPENLKQKDFFKYYQEHFTTVELNSPFYRLPSVSTFQGWKENTAKDFIFSVKASRYITHIKKLKDAKDALKNLFERIDFLEEKLGPILFQLPPAWKYNEMRFKEFLNLLPPDYRYTFEFRNNTWHNDEVYDLLQKQNISFCIYEIEYQMSPIVSTANFIYIRLHGPEGKYQGLYSNSAMEWWAEKIKGWLKQNKDVFIYIDNDQNGYAATNALRLKELIH